MVRKYGAKREKARLKACFPKGYFKKVLYNFATFTAMMIRLDTKVLIKSISPTKTEVRSYRIINDVH